MSWSFASLPILMCLFQLLLVQLVCLDLQTFKLILTHKILLAVAVGLLMGGGAALRSKKIKWSPKQQENTAIKRRGERGEGRGRGRGRGERTEKKQEEEKESKHCVRTSSCKKKK